MDTIDMFEVQEETDLFTVHTRQCVECGATFKTCGKGKRCSSCLVMRIDAPVIGQTARITCRAHGLMVDVPLDHPTLLCLDCLADLDATRAWVLRDIQAIQVKELAALATFDALRIYHASFWAKLDRRPAGSDARARAKHPTYALLLDAEQAYHAALTPLAAERARLERALELIDSL